MEYWNGAFLEHGFVLDLRLRLAEPLGPLLTGFPWLRAQHRPGGNLLPPVKEPVFRIRQQKNR
jgi:hypothetical protein